MLGTNLEEIIVQSLADLEQQVGVNPRALKQFVHVFTSAVYLRCQPCDATPLSCQLCFDKLPYTTDAINYRDN